MPGGAKEGGITSDTGTRWRLAAGASTADQLSIRM